MEYRAITLPDSGEVVLVQPLPPLLLGNILKNNPAPLPPVQQNNLGTEQAPRWEESANESDPDYIEEQQAWTLAIERKMRVMSLELGARIEWDDEKRVKLAALKRAAEKAEEVLEGDDDFLYVSYVAIRTAKDYQHLLKEIGASSRPTEEAIQEGIATFRAEPNGNGADVQGEEHLPNQSTA